MTNNIVDYYSNYDEESRLIKDNAHRIEFDMTNYALESYIKPNSRMLDIGAGTGRYSFYYALKGISIFSMDLVEKHIEVLNNKLDEFKDLEMKVAQGNALDLSRFKEGEFDSILCMGPLYHLANQNEQYKCLSECKRVLCQNGILAVAYINKNTHRELGNNLYFIGLDSKYIEEALIKSGFKIIDHIAIDGITPKIGGFINMLDENGYKAWLDFNQKICRSKISIERTLHALVIAEKS